jgi:FkbM family methyltransferase
LDHRVEPTYPMRFKPGLSRSLAQAVSMLASIRLARQAVVQVYKAVGAFSSATGIDPVLELPLGPLGVPARFSFHVFNRDINFILQVFVLHIYERHCKLQAGDVVVDCGAYIGDFTTRASRIVGPQGKVLAFEANPKTYSICEKNIRTNGLTNVQLYNVALGDRTRTGYLKVDRINLGATRIVEEESTLSSQAINVRTLSEFLPVLDGRPIKLLKMNVEGYAVKILAGAPELLEKRLFQNFAAEIHPGEEGLRRLLEDHGYQCRVEGPWLYASSASMEA